MTREEIIKALQTIELPETKQDFVEYVSKGSLIAYEKEPIVALSNFYRVRIVSRPTQFSRIISEIWLPEEWNERFVGLGNSGISGHISYSVLAKYMTQKYACMHTDLGTSDGKLCGYYHPEIQEDFGWRATHIATVCSKELIRACYGQSPKFSYFIGNSTGGMQGYAEAQRFPLDYDGILNGVPSFCNIAFHPAELWNYVKLHDENKKPLFSTEEIKLLAKLALNFMKSHNGASIDDDFVSNPYPYEGVIDDFLSYVRENTTFTEKQYSALYDVYHGARNPITNKQLACGFPIGAEIGLSDFLGENCPGIYQFLWQFGPLFDPFKYDFSSQHKVAENSIGKNLSSYSTDFTAFRDNGGKLLAYSGTADTCVLHQEVTAHYQKTAESMGGIEECMKFFRYYVLPGRAHCGGPGLDSLYANESKEDVFHSLVSWVEEGIAPFSLVAFSNPDKNYPDKKLFSKTVYPLGTENNPFYLLPPTFINS